jgi:hypothetical protein
MELCVRTMELATNFKFILALLLSCSSFSSELSLSDHDSSLSYLAFSTPHYLSNIHDYLAFCHHGPLPPRNLDQEAEVPDVLNLSDEECQYIEYFYHLSNELSSLKKKRGPIDSHSAHPIEKLDQDLPYSSLFENYLLKRRFSPSLLTSPLPHSS